MNRLVAFGCSLTYGHGLPDCFIPPYDPGEEPSKLAWPQLVADKLNLECINLSSPGSSNKRIWHNIINFEFEKNDLVFIMWSYKERSAILIGPNTVEDLATWIKDKRSMAYYKFLYNDYDSSIQSKLYVSHANLFLKEKNIAVYNLITDKKYKNIFELANNTISHIPLYISDNYINKYPKALDNSHPGIECNQVFSNDIIENIDADRY